MTLQKSSLAEDHPPALSPLSSPYCSKSICPYSISLCSKDNTSIRPLFFSYSIPPISYTHHFSSFLLNRPDFEVSHHAFRSIRIEVGGCATNQKTTTPRWSFVEETGAGRHGIESFHWSKRFGRVVSVSKTNVVELNDFTIQRRP